MKDSQAIDFDETEKFGVDNVIVRNCHIMDVYGGYAIRGSARNITIEDVQIDRCQNGVYLAYIPPGTDNAFFTAVPGIEGSTRMLYNVRLKNIISNGNDVPDAGGADVVNSLIRIRGYSKAVPIFARIEGCGTRSNSNYPSANPEYGIWTENCDLTLIGAFMHGRSAMVYMEGWKNLKCKDAQFHPQPGATTHMVLLDGGEIENVVMEDVRVIGGSLDAGYNHVRLVNAPTITGKMYKTRSPDISAISAGITVVTT